MTENMRGNKIKFAASNGKVNHLPAKFPFDHVLIEALLTAELRAPVFIESFTVSGGGCINDCFVLKTSAGSYFLKRNDAKRYPKMFETEAAGLQLLTGAVDGIAPKVIARAEHGHDQYLILEYINAGPSQKEFWPDVARKLAALHRTSNDFFGLDHDNYIGSLPQSNKNHDDWNSFFILERLEPQVKMAVDARKLPSSIHRSLEKLFSKLPDIFPAEKPSLLHGDLWSGNYMTGANGLVKLIDPAVYFGFRAMDLAMSKLFGGFDSSLYRLYHEFFPLENGFEKRVDICNLYPLLVHVNLFGGHYANEVTAIVSRFR
jgi:fructosamine-3-kinase